MELNGFYGGIYRVCEWVTRLATLNLLWVLFTLFGLVLFGIFPASAAVFAVSRKWVLGDVNVPVFRTFLSFFLKDFWKSQIIGFIFLFIGLVLLLDLKFFLGQESFFSQVMLFITLNLAILFLIAIVYLFPVFAHFEWNLSQYMKQPLFIGILNPFFTIAMVAGFIGLIALLGYIPKLFFFFGASGIACYLTWFAQKSFQNVDAKKKKIYFANS